MDDEHRRAPPVGVARRVPLLPLFPAGHPVPAEVMVGKVELIGGELVGGAEGAVVIDERFEPAAERPSLEPVHAVAAEAGAEGDGVAAVDVGEVPLDVVEAAHEVVVRQAAPLARDGVGEALAEACGPRRVRAHDDVALLGEEGHVPARGPRVGPARLRPAVHHERERVLFRGVKIRGADHPGVHLVRGLWVVPGALEPHLRDLAVRQAVRGAVVGGGRYARHPVARGMLGAERVEAAVHETRAGEEDVAVGQWPHVGDGPAVCDCHGYRVGRGRARGGVEQLVAAILCCEIQLISGVGAKDDTGWTPFPSSISIPRIEEVGHPRWIRHIGEREDVVLVGLVAILPHGQECRSSTILAEDWRAHGPSILAHVQDKAFRCGF